MRHFLLASTCVFALATPLLAETKIQTASAPVRTATINVGAPGDIFVPSAGLVTTSGPVAATVDSNNKQTNRGTIQWAASPARSESAQMPA